MDQDERADNTTADLVAVLKDVFATYKGRAKPTPAPRHADRDTETYYPIADQHNGLLAWGREPARLMISTSAPRGC